VPFGIRIFNKAQTINRSNVNVLCTIIIISKILISIIN